jgi:hypothetical protein
VLLLSLFAKAGGGLMGFVTIDITKTLLFTVRSIILTIKLPDLAQLTMTVIFAEAIPIQFQ